MVYFDMSSQLFVLTSCPLTNLPTCVCNSIKKKDAQIQERLLNIILDPLRAISSHMLRLTRPKKEKSHTKKKKKQKKSSIL